MGGTRCSCRFFQKVHGWTGAWFRKSYSSACWIGHMQMYRIGNHSGFPTRFFTVQWKKSVNNSIGFISYASSKIIRNNTFWNKCEFKIIRVGNLLTRPIPFLKADVTKNSGYNNMFPICFDHHTRTLLSPP